MLLNTETKLINKPLTALLLLSITGLSTAYAQPVQCNSTSNFTNSKLICADKLSPLRDQLNDKYLTAYLVTDAPLRLIDDTHRLWINRLQQCKSTGCVKAQFELRLEDLNFYTSMNQSLTQHFIKYENGKIAKSPVHLQVHQLSKDRIKIEGLAYRNPNNRTSSQTVSLLAYTIPNKKNEILDNEHDCKYQLNFQKALLVLKTTQVGCEKFSGVYRLYD